jgi:type IV secretory pathway VirB2 component (pilin)
MKQAIKHRKILLKKVKHSILWLGLLISLPNIAFAGTKVGEIIGYLCDWLSGEVGAAIAVLVVIYSGYEMLEGRLEKKTLAGRCIAIGLIIGGAVVATNVFHIGEFS